MWFGRLQQRRNERCRSRSDARWSRRDPFAQIVTVESVAAHQAVDSVAKQKADFVKMLSSVPRDAYFAAAEESKKRGIVFVGHVPQNITAAEASDVGQKSIEHLDGILLNCSSQEEALRKEIAEALAKENFAAFAGIRVRMLDTYDPAKAALLFEKFKKNGTWQVPTFSFLRTQTLLPEAKKLAEPYLSTCPKHSWLNGFLLRKNASRHRKIRLSGNVVLKDS